MLGRDSPYFPDDLLYILYKLGAMYDDIRPYDHNHGCQCRVLSDKYADEYDVPVRFLQFRLWTGGGAESYCFRSDTSLYNSLLYIGKKEGAL